MFSITSGKGAEKERIGLNQVIFGLEARSVLVCEPSAAAGQVSTDPVDRLGFEDERG
jgi:hypothetical protein